MQHFIAKYPEVEIMNMISTNRVTRIQMMEELYEELLSVVHASENSIFQNTDLRNKWEILKDYYENGQWLSDYEADENGELILVDYKTDFFSDSTKRSFVEKTLRERHGQQLGYYKLACETLFGQSPAHTYVYAFALNDTVEI